MQNLERYERVLKKMDNVKLMDVAQNFSRYGYPLEVKKMAEGILAGRDISADDHDRISFQNTITQQNQIPHLSRIQNLKESINKNIKLATIFLSLQLFSILLIAFSPVLGFATIALGISNWVFLFKALNRISDIDDLLGNESQESGFFSVILVLTIIGLYLYVLFQNSNLKEELKRKGI